MGRRSGVHDDRHWVFTFARIRKDCIKVKLIKYSSIIKENTFGYLDTSSGVLAIRGFQAFLIHLEGIPLEGQKLIEIN